MVIPLFEIFLYYKKVICASLLLKLIALRYLVNEERLKKEEPRL